MKSIALPCYFIL